MLLIKIIKTFTFPAIIFLIHLILIYFNSYLIYGWIDVPMHFLGGFAVSFTYFSLIKILQKNNYLSKMNNLIFFIFVISLVALTAVLWEFAEFIIDLSLKINVQKGLQDTMLDLFLGLVGGIAGFLIKDNFLNNTNNYKPLTFKK